jgi:D-alanyl-D-alanine carboxypeptidase
MPPASLTKILTAILAIEYGKLDDVITVAPEDLAGESTMGLVAGEQQTLRNLLYGMLLPSGNDAATTVARYLGTHIGNAGVTTQDPVARFSDMMNARVAQLGLTDSHFVTPHGLDTPDHYSTAYDLASLSWYAMHLSVFNEIVRTVQYDAPGHALLNTNEMLTRYDGADGIKTGWTDGCGLCLVTSATRDGHRLISVVLNAPNWYSDSTVLLDYGFSVLAATPVDPSAEVLAITKRDTVTWLLANPEVVPPVLQEPALAKGGGAAPENQQPHLAAPAPHQQDVAGSKSETASASTFATGKAESGTLPAVVLFGLVAMASCFFLARLWTSRRGLSAFLPIGRTAVRTGPSSEGNGKQSPHPPRVRARNWAIGRSATVTTPKVLPSTTRRRDPNLLVEQESSAYHIERAIDLASQGKQGSGMSEFVTALRSGAEIDVAELAEQHILSSEAFLALARAQLAVGRRDEARRTLLHGVLVLPGERVLRLALYQLHPEN